MRLRRLLPSTAAVAVAFTVAVAVPGATALALLTAATAGATAGATASPSPTPSGFTISDPRIKESSGLAASRIHPGVYWTHNDSDDGPYVYAVDSATGKTVARVTMTGVGRPRDIEAISLGPDGQLYVGDIGDNLGGTWDHVWIYRFPEPKTLGDVTLKAEQFTVKYADGPRNAEALMVHPVTGRVYIASKDERAGGLYEGPETLSPPVRTPSGGSVTSRGSRTAPSPRTAPGSPCGATCGRRRTPGRTAARPGRARRWPRPGRARRSPSRTRRTDRP